MTDQDRDILLLALTAYGEARNQGPDGIRAQVHSVLNRHRCGRWYSGKTLAACVMRPYAYSMWLDKNALAVTETPMADAILAQCEAAARRAISGLTQDPTDGATHYYVNGTKEPDWVSGIDSKTGKQVAPPATFCKQIGDHLYFKDVT